MKDDKEDNESTRREKENMDQPQEEFISDEPPSRTENKSDDFRETVDKPNRDEP